MSSPVATPPRAPRLSTVAVTRDILVNGLEYDQGFYARLRGHDFVRFRAGTRRFVAIAHPDYIDHVLHGGTDRYHKAYEYELLAAVLKRSLFTDEDESWRRHRKLLTPTFSKRHLDGLVELMIAPIVELADRIEAGGDRAEIEMVDEMVTVTLDVIGNALFSQQFASLRHLGDTVTDGLRLAERFTRLFLVAAPPTAAVHLAVAFLQTAPRLPLVGSLQHVIKEVDTAVWKVVRERRAHPTDAPDLLNHLLTASDEHGTLPLDRVRNEALTFMLAGHETTANAMSWMWYLLCLNPDARNRMRDEVDTVLQGRRPTVEDLRGLPFTTACVQESMRYFSPAWVLPRVAVADDWIGGHRIRRGTTVIIPVHHVHHDPRWWPDPEEYRPERFLGDAPRERHRSAYLPFGGGRRICIGTSFALMEATLIAAILTQRFQFDLVPGHPVDPEATLTLRPRYGLKMIARHRHAADEALAA